MKMEYTKIKNINEYVSESINPMKTPNTIFEVYSVPSFDTGHPEYLRGDEIASNKVVVRKNDVLLCKINPRINRVWVVADESQYQNIASSEWIVVRNSEYNPEFLAWYFRNPKFKMLMMSEVTGIGGSLTRAQPKAVAAYVVPVMERKEQDAIAEVLNKVDGVIKARQQELMKLDDLVKARFVELFGDAVSNPMNWPVKKLKDLAVQINSGNTPKGGSENYVDEGITFFRSQNVWKDRLEMDDIAYIDAETHASMKRSSLKHGDILMTKTGRINTENSSLGRAALYMGEDDRANVNGHVYFIRLKPEVNNKFVLRILVSPEYRDLIRSVCVGGIDKRQLNKEHIEDFPIICPPTDMIDSFIAFVEQVDKSKVVVQKALDEAQTLFDSLMQEYFG